MPFLKFLRTCNSSASIESEISSGVTAPISKPAGAFIFLIYESAKPFSASLAFNEENFLLLPTNETNVASAWSSFQSSESALTSVRSQVNAAEIANEGITVEYETGLGRTTLDVIQSNTILLTSKINLANSERNFFLSQLELLKSVGLLNAKYLKIVK